MTTTTRIQPLDPATATGQAKTILDGTKGKFGAYLNFFTTLAKAPVVLSGYTSLSSALASGGLPPKIREQIAVAISSQNGCGYCMTAHGHAATANGVDAEALARLFTGETSDPAEQAALHFAFAVLDNQGRVTDADLAAVREAGFDDGAILEIIAHVSMTIFSNALNNVSEPQIDLPALPVPLPTAS